MSRKIGRRDVHARRRQTEHHLGMPMADWRVKKRQQWQAVVDALERFNWGSAYTPAGDDLYEVERAARRISAALREEWVCW